MAGITDLGLFIVAGLLLNITPGPDLLYVISSGAAHGKKAGVVAALGIGAGCLVHILLAAFGLSVVFLSSPWLFTALTYMGAGYLIYLGVTTLYNVKKRAALVDESRSSTALSIIFRQAVFINIFNPKVGLFFLAFLPQFVSPQAESPATAFLFLGLLFNVNGTLVNTVFGLLASSISEKMETTRGTQFVLKSLAGLLFLGFGVRLAFFS